MIRKIELQPDNPVGNALGDQILDRLAEHGKAHATCGHVLDQGVLCTQHPDLGVLCIPCGKRHLGVHDWAVEHTCDRCGCGDHSMSAATMTLGTILRDRFVIVHTIGAGLCQRCFHLATGQTGGVG